MNKKFLILLFFFALIFSFAVSISHSKNILQEDEITFSYKYLNDTTQQGGWNYGAEFYLTNNTEFTQRVTWSFREPKMQL